MVAISIDKAFFKIVVFCKRRGEKIASSSLLNAAQIKNTLRLVAQDTYISGEMRVDSWVINLGGIPAAQFDTLFIPRLAQAFAKRLAHEQALLADQHGARLPVSNVTESSVLLGASHLDSKAVFQLACDCLTPSTLTALLLDNPAYPLHLLLKRLLNEVWPAPNMLPVAWYSRVTASRLSIAALLYLFKRQQGRDWLMSQQAPSADQVTDWVKAIAQGEIPPEQITHLLTVKRSAVSALSEQRVYAPSVVMHWLLPLWRQPAVRQAIHRLNGRQAVQHIDVSLSSCLQQQNEAIREGEIMHADPEQSAPERKNVTLPGSMKMNSDPLQGALVRESFTSSENKGSHTALLQVALARDSSMLPEDKGMHSESLQVARARANSTSFGILGSKDWHAAQLKVEPMRDNAVLSEGKRRHTALQQLTLSRDSSSLPESGGGLTAPEGSIRQKENYFQPANGGLSFSQSTRNAGLILLWPLLPQLFSHLGLWSEEQFINEAARWQAVHCLERLAWGEVAAGEWLTLNQVLCGISLFTPEQAVDPLDMQQQQQIDEWLTTISRQLVGWQKLSLTDIRQLFLQRAGEISMEGAFLQIGVHSEPYDFLLRDWPWPMTLASFPWMKLPLTIVWPVNGFTR
ncbi:hypothetical protein JFQ86_16380 [Serratia ureilytica]|uniref:contractile injection system tape measure protein n=1 Tax=Serratia ureilytica TaxID=300181 RepID=UPI0018E79287|nr:contractile injection system tape measure protein [Serratia ureilytica]MBJ2114407.1 hypothetical protein [Serratia ureilytica]